MQYSGVVYQHCYRTTHEQMYSGRISLAKEKGVVLVKLVVACTMERVRSTLDQRYECPICLSCLRNPALTSCGHRFCMDCIQTCLNRRGRVCPVDGKPLSKEDIFLDNYTRREIQNQRIECPYGLFGCEARLCPVELEQHVQECLYQPRESASSLSGSCEWCGDYLVGQNSQIHLDECSKAPVVCNFKQFGCDAVLPKDKIPSHLASQIHDHLNLVADAYSKLTVSLNDMNKVHMDFKEQEALHFWDPRPKGCATTNGNTHGDELVKEETEVTSCKHDEVASYQGLLTAMYERIVMLEQKNRVQDIQIENILSKLNAANAAVPNMEGMFKKFMLEMCNGVFIWRVPNFSKKHTAMLSNQTPMFYSPGFYTSPYGYKFCARLNVSATDTSYMALLIHLMKGEHDACLDWPFTGKITFTLVNQRDTQRHFKETMMSRSDLAAFKRPMEDTNPRGFGYTEFITFQDISSLGYLMNDELFIKIEVQSV